MWRFFYQRWIHPVADLLRQQAICQNSDAASESEGVQQIRIEWCYLERQSSGLSDQLTNYLLPRKYFDSWRIKEEKLEIYCVDKLIAIEHYKGEDINSIECIWFESDKYIHQPVGFSRTAAFKDSDRGGSLQTADGAVDCHLGSFHDCSSICRAAQHLFFPLSIWQNKWRFHKWWLYEWIAWKSSDLMDRH